MLNLARAVQGVGGAMMFATSLALIAQAFHGSERGIAFGVFGAVIGAAVAVGPVVGGLITSGIGWEWIFFVNVADRRRSPCSSRSPRSPSRATPTPPASTGPAW